MKRKFKLGQKVIHKQSRLGIVYRVFSYTKYQDGTVSYNIYTDDDHQVVYEYQIRKYKPNKINYQGVGQDQ